MGEFLFRYIPDFFWSLGAFVVFVLLFYRLGVTRILAAVARREAGIEADIAAAATAAEEAATSRARLQEQLAGAEARIAAMMEEARRDADALRERAVAAGRAEVAAMHHKALRDIDETRDRALRDLQRDIADIATDMAARILERELDPDTHRAFVERCLAEIGAEA